MNLFITSAPCGSGKSHYIRDKIKRYPAKHIVSVPTHRLVQEYADALKGLNVFTFLYDEEDGVSVAKLINAERQRVENDGHAVFLITHAALLRSLDHDQFSGWYLWIDEALTLQNQGVHNSSSSRVLLEKLYDLTPIGGFSEITLKADAVETVQSINDDTLISNLADLHRRVTDTREQVFTALKSWADLDRCPRWYSFSRFDVERLKAFKKVHMFANAVTKTVTYQLLADNPNVQIQMVPLPARNWVKRPVVVNYFADNHLLSQSALDQFAKGNIRLIEAWAKAQPWCTPADHMWMTNRTGIPFEVPGDRVSPRSHGLNVYADRTACTALFKAKPSPVERAMHARCGIDEWRVIAEREHEVIAQTVMRGSIRDAASSEPFTATVYDHVQARELATFLRDNYGLAVEVRKVDLDGFDDRAMDRAPIRGDAARTPAERAAQKAKQKESEARRMREKRWRLAGKDVEIERHKWAQKQSARGEAA